MMGPRPNASPLPSIFDIGKYSANMGLQKNPSGLQSDGNMVVIREMFVNKNKERRTTEGTRKSILAPLLNEHAEGKSLAEANIQANL